MERLNLNKAMKTTIRNATIVCALAGVLATASQSSADTLRYRLSGTWDTVVTTTEGWGLNPNNPANPVGARVPIAGDEARVNWGGSTVTVTNATPVPGPRVMIGVDESGVVVVESGAILTGNDVLAGNNNPAATGTLTVNDGGIVNVSNILWAANNLSTGFININTGGVVNVASHLWWGVSGTAEINISGTLVQTGGILGLGTSNATTPGGGTATVNLLDGGLLALNNISSNTNLTSIQPGSVININGNGQLTVPGDFGQVITNYVNADKIIAYSGAGTVNVLVDEVVGVETNTIVTATPPIVVPTAVWIPANNTNNSNGLWSDGENWDGGVIPTAGSEAILNVSGTIPCKVTGFASAARIVANTSGAGGTLILTNGANLSVGAASASIIGETTAGTMVVESGAAADFAGDLYIGDNSGAVGQFTMNGGAVEVAGTFGLGYNGGTGTANINGGTLTLAVTSLVYPSSISGGSVLDVAGSGAVVILGDAEFDVLDWIATGNITGNGVVNPVNGVDIFVTYDFDADVTTISGSYIPPGQTVWNPAANPVTEGSWHNGTNWTEGLPGSGTKTVFNVVGATNCWVTSAAVTDRIVIGDGGPGGTVIVTNGGTLTVENSSTWSAISYNDTSGTATLVVEDGGSVSFGYHLWIGHQPGAIGTLIMNGGTVSVGQQFGLGWSGGTGTALIKAGTLDLFQIAYPQSISATSVLDVSGTGEVRITGDRLTAVGNFVADGKITLNGGPNVIYYYLPSPINKTVISTVAPSTEITDIDCCRRQRDGHL